MLSAVLAALFAGRAVAAVECPVVLPAPHTDFEQIGSSPAAGRPLSGLRLLDGAPGEEAKSAPVELAPDSTTRRRGGFINTWIFAGDEALLMVCNYHGTSTYYRAQPRPLPRTCTLRQDGGKTIARCD